MPKYRCHYIFLHGLAKKPPPDKLETIWLDSLAKDNPKPEVFGYSNPGLRVLDYDGFTLTYWADVFHTDFETDLSSYEEAIANPSSFEGVARTQVRADAVSLPTPRNDAEARFLQAFAAQTGLSLDFDDDHEAAVGEAEQVVAGQLGYSLERVPLPMGIKKQIIKKLASEAYYYLFDVDYTRADGQVFQPRSEIRRRVIEDIRKAKESAERVVIVSHSMGTIIAYDCLRNCPECPEVDGLVTLGTPLGVDEVQDQLKPPGASAVDFPSEKLKGEWVNVYDKLDVVCAADPRLANDFKRDGAKVISDVNEQNWSEWRHNISHYLKGPQLRTAVRRLGNI